MSFSSSLIVKRLEGDKWEVMAPLTYYLDNAAYEFIVIHKGFVTDFGSMPFPFSRIFLPLGKSYDQATVLHDCLYWLPVVWSRSALPGVDATARTISRGEADRIFLDAMASSKTPFTVRQSLYAGVRLGGWKPWNKYRRENIID